MAVGSQDGPGETLESFLWPHADRCMQTGAQSPSSSRGHDATSTDLLQGSVHSASE